MWNSRSSERLSVPHGRTGAGKSRREGEERKYLFNGLHFGGLFWPLRQPFVLLKLNFKSEFSMEQRHGSCKCLFSEYIEIDNNRWVKPKKVLGFIPKLVPVDTLHSRFFIKPSTKHVLFYLLYSFPCSFPPSVYSLNL